MTRTFGLMVVVLLAATALLFAGQEPQFRASSHTVSIYATVLDGGGRLVPDLNRDDFQVFDNGKPQPLTLFQNAIQPITIVLMLDRSGSMASNFDLVKDAASAFVGNLLPADRARVGSFSDRIRIDPGTFTSDQTTLREILDLNLLPAGATPLWSATSLAMDALADLDGRRVVLMFTDGKDSPQPGFGVKYEEVRRRSETQEIMVYGIGFSERCATRTQSAGPTPLTSILFQRRRPGGGVPQGPRGRPGVPRPGLPLPGRPPTRFPPPVGGLPPLLPPAEPTRPGPVVSGNCRGSGPDPDLRDLAAVGGGGYFELRATDDLRSTFSRVADELHHQYMLAFSPDTLDNTLHQVEVRVRNSNYSARTRRTYFAGRSQ
ncbi:MAG: VWA domain-containing protein [Vicinamibacterales bacterium]